MEEEGRRREGSGIVTINKILKDMQTWKSTLLSRSSKFSLALTRQLVKFARYWNTPESVHTCMHRVHSIMQ